MGNPVAQTTGAFFHKIDGEDPLSKQRWWIVLRWLLVGVVILATLIGNQLIHLQTPNLTVLLLCAILVLLNAPFHYYFFVIKKKDPYLDSKLIDRFTYFQFAIDWVFLTLIFHYTGGIASPLLFYFLFHVILSGGLLERQAYLLYVTLIALTINLLALLELVGYIPHFYG